MAITDFGPPENNQTDRSQLPHRLMRIEWIDTGTTRMTEEAERVCAADADTDADDIPQYCKNLDDKKRITKTKPFDII